MWLSVPARKRRLWRIVPIIVIVRPRTRSPAPPPRAARQRRPSRKPQAADTGRLGRRPSRGADRRRALAAAATASDRGPTCYGKMPRVAATVVQHVWALCRADPGLPVLVHVAVTVQTDRHGVFGEQPSVQQALGVRFAPSLVPVPGLRHGVEPLAEHA